MSFSKQFIRSELTWKHTLPYAEFLDAVINKGIERLKDFQQKTKYGPFVYEHGYRAYKSCRGKDYLWIAEAYTRAKHRYKVTQKHYANNSGLKMGMDNYQKALGWVCACMAVAYGITYKPDIIDEAARSFVKELLGETQLMRVRH